MSAPRIGFRFVPMPVEIWDDPICRNFTLAEFRLFGYLARHQVRFGKGIVEITQDELLNGLWINKEGKNERWGMGCGLTHKTLKHALVSLQQRGWIEVRDISDSGNVRRLAVTIKLASDETEEARARVEEKRARWQQARAQQQGNPSYDLGETPNSLGSDSQVTWEPLPSASITKENKVLEKNTPIRPQRGEKHVSSSESEKAQKDKAGRIVRETIFPYYIKTVKPDGKDIYTLTKGRLSQGVLRMLETLDKCEGDWKIAEALMKIAIDTMAASDFHMGLHPKTEGRKYNDWKYLFRTAEKLEEWFVRSEEDTHAKSSAY